jgi:hypothetical protein
MRMRTLRHALRFVLACGFLAAGMAGAEDIDWERARELRRRFTSGERLTQEERAYLERARAERARGRGRPGTQRALEPRSSTGMKPLADMEASEMYQREDGGLYGKGKNEPPQEHLQAALEQARQIQPLDAEGRTSPTGKTVLLSIGMSNTTQEFSQFQRLAATDRDIAPHVEIVDGAQGGMDARAWSQPDDRRDPWAVLDQRLMQAGVAPRQVQVIWLKQARINPAGVGEFPKHAEELKGHLKQIVQKLKGRFPNLRLAYISSRTYAGYGTGALNPEPYAYESAFAVRWLIQEQIEGASSLNYDSDQGELQAPLLLWGPYLWADGVEGRQSDRLVWLREDFAGDGIHPSQSGRQKVGEQLLSFLKADSTAKTWFVR